MDGLPPILHLHPSIPHHPLALASPESLVDLDPDLDPESLASPVDHLDLERVAREAPAPARTITTTAIGFTYPPRRRLAPVERVERRAAHLERVERVADLDLQAAQAALMMDMATGDLPHPGDLTLAPPHRLLASLARVVDQDHLERVERAVDLDHQAVQAALVMDMATGDLPHRDLTLAPARLLLASLARAVDQDHLDLERAASPVDLDPQVAQVTMDHTVDGMVLGAGDLTPPVAPPVAPPHRLLANLERVAVKH